MEAGEDHHLHPEEAGSQEEAALGQHRQVAVEAGPAETPTQALGRHLTPSSSTGHPPPSQDHPRHLLLAETETASEAADLSIRESHPTQLTPTEPSSTQATILRR